MTCPARAGPKTSLASWARTVGNAAVYGVACVTCASQEMPAIRNTTIDPCQARICRACRPSGGFSALTAFETASIPVSDEPPLAKARAMM